MLHYYELPKVLLFILLSVILSGCGVHQTSVNFTSGNDNSINLKGYIYRPEKDGALPTIILLHGSGDLPSYTKKWGSWLASEGYASIVIDSKSTRKNMPRYRDMMLDVVGALSYSKSLSFVDHDRIGVMGFSQGGAVTLDAISENRTAVSPNELKAAVAFYPVCTAFRMDTNVPILLLLGEMDYRTPSDGCVQTAKQLKKAGKDVHWVVYKGAKHVFDNPNSSHYSWSATADAKKRILVFLKQYLN